MSLSLASARPRHASGRRPVRLPLFLTVWAERRALSRMTPDQLRDIGVAPQDALIEAARPIWDVPAHRR